MSVEIPTVDEIRAVVREELRAFAELPALLSQKQLARQLGVCERTIAYLRRDGMPHVWVGGLPRFELGPVLAWVAEHGTARAVPARAEARSTTRRKAG